MKVRITSLAGWLVPKLQLGNPCLSSSCLFVYRSSGSRSFKDRVPKLELGNEQNTIRIRGLSWGVEYLAGSQAPAWEPLPIKLLLVH